MSASMAAKSIGSAISVRNCASTSRGLLNVIGVCLGWVCVWGGVRMAAVYYDGKVDADGHHWICHAHAVSL